MTTRRIYRYILLFTVSLLTNTIVCAQSQKPIPSQTSDSIPLLMEKQLFFNAAGLVLWQFSDYGEIEGGVRLNLKGKYFPVIEAGIGVCDKTHDETDIHYKTSSPFVRVGCDYNFMKNKQSDNLIYGGLRLGYSTFKYDMDAPSLDDPYWDGSVLEYNFKGVSSNATWAEFVFGLETKIFKNLRMGWTARYKRRLKHKTTNIGKAWYIPGYGENDGHLFTGTFNIVFCL